LIYIRDECQTIIHPNSYPTYNERQQKIIEMIDWVVDKYKTTVKKKRNQENEEQEVVIENIIEELDKKREIAINKKQSYIKR